MDKLLEVKDLRVSFKTYAGTVQAVRGVNFHVNKGEVLAIVGESGCGKTVTSKSLLNLLPPDNSVIGEGSELVFEGENILKYNEKEWRSFRGDKAAMIFQDALTSLNPTMKIGKQIAENLIEHKNMTKQQAMDEAIRLLKLVGIPNPESRVNQYPHEFSGGMRQRAMIAIALACTPKLLIADEPTTALDVTIQAQILELIKDLKDRLNTSVILITHDLGVVAGLADRIVVMYGGKVVESGVSREVFYNTKHPYTKTLLKAVPRLDLKNKEELIAIPGTPPDLLNPPVGCPFAARCNYAMAICRKHEPSGYKFDKEHEAFCWLHHEYAPNTEFTAKEEGTIDGIIRSKELEEIL
ncbi:MAG: ABC transporter ATP-binding protein [Clostridium sp.]